MTTVNLPNDHQSNIAPPKVAAPSEKVEQIQENLIAYFRLYAGLPGMTFVDTEDLVWMANQGFPGNLVLHTKLFGAAIDQQIDKIINQIGQQAAQFDWFVFPSCQPIDLGERLAARGLAGGPDGSWALVAPIGGPGGTWMLLDLPTQVSAPPVPPNFHIQQVRDQAMLETWLRVSSAGFGHDLHLAEKIEEHPFYAFYAAYARHGFGPGAYSLHYIGYLDDEPVTSSTLLLAGGIAGLFDISTPPAFRRQGFGSAISWAMLQEAQKHNYQGAYVWSSNMGKGIYGSVGFAKVEIGMREYQWKKR